MIKSTVGQEIHRKKAPKFVFADDFPVLPYTSSLIDKMVRRIALRDAYKIDKALLDMIRNQELENREKRNHGMPFFTPENQ